MVQFSPLRHHIRHFGPNPQKLVILGGLFLIDDIAYIRPKIPKLTRKGA